MLYGRATISNVTYNVKGSLCSINTQL